MRAALESGRSGSLASPRTKLDRAQQHLDALQCEMRAFLRREPYRISFDYDPEMRKHIGSVVVIENTRYLSAILGDAMHNARSALDHLVWQLVLANEETPGRHNSFPIYTSESDFIRNVRCRDPKRPGRSPLEGVRYVERTLIERFQPYERPDHPLAVLHELDRDDKHRTLNVVATRIVDEVPTLNLSGDFKIAELVVRPGVDFVDGAEVMEARFVPEPDPKAQIKGVLAVNIRFSERLLPFSEVARLKHVAAHVIEEFADCLS